MACSPLRSRSAARNLLAIRTSFGPKTHRISDNPPGLPVLFSGDVSWAFYTNAVGSSVPGAILDERTTKPSFIFTGQCPMTCLYRTDVNLPTGLQLASGTYWLELHDGMTL